MKERYLIINPGRPGQRRKVKRKSRSNPANPQFVDSPFEPNEDIISSLKFLKERVAFLGKPISERAKTRIRGYLRDINDILIQES